MLEPQRLIDPLFQKQYAQNAPAINSNQQHPGARMVNPRRVSKGGVLAIEGAGGTLETI